MMDHSGLRSNDSMERNYNRNNGKIIGRDAILNHDKYKQYRHIAERAANIFVKDR